MAGTYRKSTKTVQIEIKSKTNKCKNCGGDGVVKPRKTTTLKSKNSK